MSSIAVHGGPAPHAAIRDAVEWGRVVVATVARGVVATLLGLALWAAAPALIGWQPTTVMTGSMEPRIVPGDVVVSRPVGSGEISMGKVLLADDPDQADHLRMHRYVEDGPRRTMVTKGDANPQQDSTPIERSAVHGVAFLRIPYIGAPIQWISTGEWGRVVLLALGLTALLALCTIDGSLRRLVAEDGADDDAGPDDDAGADDAAGPADGADDGREARDGAATGLQTGASTVLTRRALRRRVRRGRRLRRIGGGAAVLVLAAAAGVLLPAQADAAPWSRTTVAPTANFTAGTATGVPTLTCAPAGSNTVTIAWTYDNGATVPASFDLMNGTTQVATTTIAGARSMTYGGAGLLNLGTTYTLHLRTNLGGSWTATSTPTVKVRVVSVLGLASASCVTA
ncbi:S24/S26 family peptidase [Curtobacterium aurantiacum]|uniref:S24/S26 family peptidase n=1 Tax=Curtobacterium aurantiacum TaxID=3236919 RepID=A0ABS5VIA3_9MICO|nr:S24/S26 family peptidase [Curtobacterium flaccumfaciens]MBT1546479.1 S24/S26 family peptidase [Curtobacterium flaccumfaciens pv. flaccumfaciens]MBT1589228.1 S24/S26 family peptidase [Curtobacterium flaccumfaciens pv. flaccumfaciens]